MSPAFSSTRSVPGPIGSGIHSLRSLSSITLWLLRGSLSWCKHKKPLPQAGPKNFLNAVSRRLPPAHAGLRRVQRAGHRESGGVGQRIKSIAAFARGRDQAALIPPLQLAQRDAGEGHHLVGAEAHVANPIENVLSIIHENVSNILRRLCWLSTEISGQEYER